MLDYFLSENADEDLDGIFEYTEIHFGIEQAITYLENIDWTIDRLCINPNLGINRHEIRMGLHSIPQGKHIIFYRIFENYIWIVRVLHMSQDLPRHL